MFFLVHLILICIRLVNFVLLKQSNSNTSSRMVVNTSVVDKNLPNTLITNLFDQLGVIDRAGVQNLTLVASDPFLAKLFRIDPGNGNLIVTRRIDRDRLCIDRRLCCTSSPTHPHLMASSSMIQRTSDSCHFKLRLVYKVKLSRVDSIAPSPTSSHLTKFASINIQLTDVNDNSPQFQLITSKPSTSSHYKIDNLVNNELFKAMLISVDESVKPFSTVTNCIPLPQAIDLDSGKFSLQRYSLERLAKQDLALIKQQLRIARPAISTSLLLDTDLPFAISMGDCLSSPAGQSSAPSLYSSSILYERPFLNFIGQLDREKNDLYWFKLLAIDGGDFSSQSHTGTLFIQLLVRDVNDNAPRVPPRLDLEVAENIAVNSIVGSVVGSDTDLGDNARLNYRLVVPDRSLLPYIKLRVDPSSGDLLVDGQLDVDHLPSHAGGKLHFQIVTSDSGRKMKLSSTTDVFVTLTDVNDELPVVKVIDLSSNTNPAFLKVEENKPPGELLAFVVVSDADSGLNGQFDCMLTNSNFSLNLDPDAIANGFNRQEFKLVTINSLDRESTPVERIGIKCSERVDSSRSYEHVVFVHVQNVNDNPPVFPSLIVHIDVKENVPINTLVHQFEATDADFDTNLARSQKVDSFNRPRLSYRLVDNADSTYFQLIESSGKLIVARTIDREVVGSRLTFNVTASDNTNPSHDNGQTTTCSVVVCISDDNDNRPTFNNSSSTLLRLSEDTDIGSVVYKFTATDSDSGINREIKYHMEDFQGTSYAIFQLNESNGTLILRKALDRETSDKYKFRVVATDKGSPRQSSIHSVEIHVLDVNDNPPKFVYPTQRNHPIALPSDIAPGSQLVKLTAFDPDEGENARLTFSFTVTPTSLSGTSREEQKDSSANQISASDLFVLDPQSGKLSLSTMVTNSQLESVPLTGSFLFEFKVEDAGSPPKSAFANVTLLFDQSVTRLGPETSNRDRQGRPRSSTGLTFTNPSDHNLGGQKSGSYHHRRQYQQTSQGRQQQIDSQVDRISSKHQQQLADARSTEIERSLIILVCSTASIVVLILLMLVILTIVKRRLAVSSGNRRSRQPRADQSNGRLHDHLQGVPVNGKVDELSVKTLPSDQCSTNNSKYRSNLTVGPNKYTDNSDGIDQYLMTYQSKHRMVDGNNGQVNHEELAAHPIALPYMPESSQPTTSVQSGSHPPPYACHQYFEGDLFEPTISYSSTYVPHDSGFRNRQACDREHL